LIVASTAGSHAAAQPAALVIGHPGHELRVHHWLERTRPIVFVLTDGSGRGGVSRLDATRDVLARTGSVPGELFGPLTDRACYDALLAGDVALFQDLARRLASALVAADIRQVASDAVEGYNPTHDVCQMLAAAAVDIAAAGAAPGRDIAHVEFPLVGSPSPEEELADGDTRLVLDDAALDRKIAAARAYPGLAGEVEAALRAHGREAFRVECLRRACASPERPGDAPFYEQHGARRVEEREYPAVVTLRDHVRPLARALRTLVDDVRARR
jgi:hypothetical protein